MQLSKFSMWTIRFSLEPGEIDAVTNILRDFERHKTARNWWEKATSMRTSTPRFHVVGLKYARKHHETYGVSSATNEKKIRSELAVVYFWIISIHPVVVYCFLCWIKLVDCLCKNWLVQWVGLWNLQTLLLF